MQTDIKMQEYDGEERRALNMIWTAAKDHSFRPEFMAFDRYGRADLYLNSIIGYVHRWYDGGKVSEMFGAFQGTALQDIYDTIFWLGLECGAYEKEREGRPGVEELRREYWAQVLEESKWSAQEKLVQSLQTGWGRMVLGEKPGVTPWERGILSGLFFDGSADTDEIMERVSCILWEYFRFDCRSEQKRKENRKRIKGMIKPFRFVRPARGVIVRNTLNEHGQDSTESGDDQCEKSGKAHKKPSDAAKGFCFWLEASSKRREEAVRSYIAMVFPCTQSSRIRLSAICSARDATAHAASILQGERIFCRSRTAGNRPDSCGRRGSRENRTGNSLKPTGRSMRTAYGA